MPNDPTNHTLELLREMRTESAQGFQLVNRKLGVLAETVNSMRVEIHGLRTDVQAIALAVDEHTSRLTDVENRLPPPPK